jgi:hypothetical protein
MLHNTYWCPAWHHKLMHAWIIDIFLVNFVYCSAMNKHDGVLGNWLYLGFSMRSVQYNGCYSNYAFKGTLTRKSISNTQCMWPSYWYIMGRHMTTIWPRISNCPSIITERDVKCSPYYHITWRHKSAIFLLHMTFYGHAIITLNKNDIKGYSIITPCGFIRPSNYYTPVVIWPSHY